MTLDRIFLCYMVAAGLTAGAAVTAAPQLQDVWLKPYFWLLILVGLFDLAVYLMRRNAPGPMLSMNARAIGFVLGGLAMVALPTIAGAPVRFF
jgi:hypothetical protein